MKKILLIALFALMVVWATVCVVDDARKGAGFFMSTAAYREEVRKGKGE